MTTTRMIANRLAAYIAQDDWAPEGVAVPRVYMDAITTNAAIEDHPTVVVIPRTSSGLYRSNPEHQIEVVLAVDASSYHANPAATDTTPEGVIVYGSGALLDELAQRLVNTIKKAEPGAILADVQIEFALDNLPIQYATITLGYKQASAYGDFNPNN